MGAAGHVPRMPPTCEPTHKPTSSSEHQRDAAQGASQQQQDGPARPQPSVTRASRLLARGPAHPPRRGLGLSPASTCPFSPRSVRASGAPPCRPLPTQQSTQGAHAGQMRTQAGSAGRGCETGRTGPGLQGGEALHPPAESCTERTHGGRGGLAPLVSEPLGARLPADMFKDAIFCCLRSKRTDQTQQMPSLLSRSGAFSPLSHWLHLL